MIGVLVSGEGTNLQALLDAGPPRRLCCIEQGRRACAGAREAGGCRDASLPAEDFETREERDDAMGRWLEEQGVTSWSAPATCTCCASRSSTGSPAGS